MTLPPTELTQLVEHLRAVRDWWREPGRTAERAADALLAMQSRIAELEEALKEIAHMNLNVPFVGVRAMDIARAALKEKNDA